MYHSGSQKNHWTFESEKELIELRMKANQKFIGQNGTDMDNKQIQAFFLNPYEESLLLKQYELHLRDFCQRFEPPMPKATIGTAFHYFKRFYLNNSPMDYHPKEILATCAYLACKVEEFNVSIQQFCSNIKGDRNKAMDIILNNELLLMQELNYKLTVHNPFRPVEGFLIDIKTRTKMPSPDRLRESIEDFLDKSYLTDACLLYAPSQIAIAAVLHAASKEQANLDSYVTECLFKDSAHKLKPLIEAVRKIRSLEKSVGEVPDKSTIKSLERKLEKCRNQDNNPDSEAYKIKMNKLLDDDDDAPNAPEYYASPNHDVSMLSTSQFGS